MAQNNFDKFRAFFKTASLWQGKLAGIQQFPLSEFDLSHLQQEELLEFPDIPVNTVLGKRAEYFYRFCIEQSNNYDLLVANIQINVPGKTLGELDYIIKEKESGKILHVELVYKFYCYNPLNSEQSIHLNNSQSEELSKYIGPNRKDNFVYKFDKLINHQLPLLYHPATITQLASLELDINLIEQRVCFLAHIFIPRKLWQHDFKYINKRCIVGYYVDKYAFAKAYTDNLYFFPEKHTWKMTPHTLENSYNHNEAVEITSQSLERSFAPLIWMLLDDKTFERFFVIT